MATETAAPAKVAGEQQGCICLVGNPNAGKTTLFNALTGLRAHTANFPGTTLELRRGQVKLGEHTCELLDMPGLYSLRGTNSEERVALEALVGQVDGLPRPNMIVLLVDSTNFVRNLYLASQILELETPVIVALNMMDLSHAAGQKYDIECLEKTLGCPVVPISARDRQGLALLRERMEDALDTPSNFHPRCPALRNGNDQVARYEWAEAIAEGCLSAPARTGVGGTEKLDRVLTHPVLGIVCFVALMLMLFYAIFSLAALPMDMIDAAFAAIGDWVGTHLPEGDLHSLLVDGIIGGVGGVVIFLPQICILFFFLAIFEDSGYLARAAFVMDRLMRKVGLPGKAFVPMLTAHACAIPAIMSTRVIENKRDRIATIMVLPLMTCSARLPVYAMVAALLFYDRPGFGALMFTCAYGLGIVAAMAMAWLLRLTVLKGKAKPLMLELPDYKWPSLRNALIMTWDRGLIFLRKAGTVILAISIVLWWLSTYPKLDEADMPAQAQAKIEQLQMQAAALEVNGDEAAAEALLAEAVGIQGTEELAHSVMGRMGRAIEPVVAPLGFNWQIGVGILSSFAAREVIVSTLSIVYGLGDEGDEEAIVERLREAKRSDGSLLFDVPTSLSLLVFFVLAMQCLPTQVVTRRETGRWSWALLQLGYMTVLAYSASLVTYQVLKVFMT